MSTATLDAPPRKAAKRADRPKVNKELKKFMPPLTADAYKLLTEQIKAYGCRSPVVLWEETGEIIDGHHTEEICHKHGVGYETVELSFPDIEAVKQFMIKTQAGRRNLTPIQDKYFLGLLYLQEVGQQGGDTKNRENVAEKLAEDRGVSPKSVENAGKLAQSITKIAEANPDAVHQILAENPNFQDVVKIGRQSEKVLEKAADKLADGKPVDEVAAGLPKPPAPTKRAAPREVKDRAGVVVPGHLNRVFEKDTRDEWKAVSDLCGQLSRELGQLAERRDGAKLRKLADDHRAKLKAIQQDVRDNEPFQVCDKCEGTDSVVSEDDGKASKVAMKNCKRCGGDGFLSRAVAEAKG